MESNPMLQQLRQTNPQVAAIFDNPQAVRSVIICLLKLRFVILPIESSLPTGHVNEGKSNDGPKQCSCHGANATGHGATERQYVRFVWDATYGQWWWSIVPLKRIRLFKPSWIEWRRI